MRRVMLICALCFVRISSTAFADSLAGVSLPRHITVDGKSLTLNGLGLRESTAFGIFKAHVYVAGLYLEKENTDPIAIINSDETKCLVLHFVRGVKAQKLQEAFLRNAYRKPALQQRIAIFNSHLSDVTKDDQILLTFKKGEVQVSIKAMKKGIIKGADFGKALLSVWLGAQPPNASLKRGLLGLN